MLTFTTPPLRAALTIGEVAELLNISAKTIRRRVNDGTIRSTRIGHLIRIPATELDRVLDPRESPSTGPHSPAARA